MTTQTQTKSFSVLVVEDDKAISALLRRNLEDGNTRVAEAPTGLDCIRMLREHGANLVLLDLRLPDFNGWGILSLLRLTDSMSDIPVIVVSVESPNEDLIARLRPSDYIQKPFDVRDLLARVKRVINLQRVDQ